MYEEWGLQVSSGQSVYPVHFQQVLHAMHYLLAGNMPFVKRNNVSSTIG
jgi:hypothetical protein